MKDIILFWVQWSWKSTQAKFILESNSNYSHFEMGNILRTLKTTNNVLWNYVRDIIDNGWVVHYSFVNALFDAYMITLHHDELMLLDGFPRTISQMYTFLDRMQRYKRDFLVIYLDLPEEIAIKRISSRRICEKCSSIHNISEWMTICDKCWWNLVQREDDKPAAIKKRIDIFYEETMPVIEYFSKMWNVIRVDASKSPQDNWNEIKHFL